MIEFTKYPNAEVWTSYMPEITAKTDYDGKVEFSVYHGTYPDGTLVFKNTLWTAAGTVAIADIGEILATYMRSQSLKIATFTLKASEATETGETALASFTACYCTQMMKMTVREWAQSMFLTTAQTLMLTERETLRLSALCHKGETELTVTAVGVTDKGTTAQCTFTGSLALQDTDGLQLVSLPGISPSLVLHQVSTLARIVKLQSFVVNYGDRSLQVFVADKPADSVTFRFLNMFGVEETLTLRGVVKKTLELTRGETIVNQTTLTYDVASQRTYELTTEPMPEDEAVRVEQLASSWKVADADGRAIDVTNTDFSYDTDNSTLKTLTLTWRYAYRRAVDETERPASAGIFSDPFTYQFS